MTDSAVIPFNDLRAQHRRIGAAIEQAIQRVLDHGQYVMGPEVGELEAALAQFTGAGHVVACASGTDALLLALLAFGAQRGDAVFVPTFTFAATAEAVALTGATPVFIDVDESYFLMDPVSLEAAIASVAVHGLRPRGIVPVDLFGQPADYDAINAIAARQDLFVIADAAQSLGATSGSARVGTLAAVTATSFFPAKPLGCYGDGGAVFTDDGDLAEVLRSLRNHGQGQQRYDHQRIGLNARMDTLQAAILIEKLRVFKDEIVRRNQVAMAYSDAFGTRMRTPSIRTAATSVWAQYTLRVRDRDRIVDRLRSSGIPTAVHYATPLHRQPAYRGFPVAPGGLAVAERLAADVVSLPMHAYLDGGVQHHIIAAVIAAITATI